MQKNANNINRAAVETLAEIWSSIEWNKVDANRAYGIWDEFASKIKASALTTNKYEKFVEKLARKMGVRSLKYKTILEISKQDDDFKNAVMKKLREETLQVVLELRISNEKNKSEKLNKEEN